MRFTEQNGGMTSNSFETNLFCDQNYSTGNCPFSNIRLHTAKHLLFFYWLTVSYGWESAEILKSIINNYKSIDN